MEILTAGSDRRNILVLLDESAEEARDFIQRLELDFGVTRTTDVDSCLKTMAERFVDLSAVIVNVDLAKANDYAFLERASAEHDFSTIPIIVSSSREITDEDALCLQKGALDFVSPPYNREVMKRRIDNAIRIKRSTTFYEIESMLRELPSNIFLKDTEGRYIFCTHYWHHLDMGDDPNWTIYGKTDLEIRKDRENAIKAMEADKEIVRTGKGTTYVIEINTDGMQEFMQLIKRPVFDKNGKVSGIIALINDVTEHELLKRELEDRANTDDLTRLGNRHSFSAYIDTIEERVDDFPLAVISADCDRLKYVNDTYGHLMGDEYLRMSALAFMTSLPHGVEAFRTGGDEFVAFLPNTSKEEADELVEAIRERQNIFKLEKVDISISLGTSVMNTPEEALVTLARADRAMYEDKAQHKRARGL